MVSNSLKFDSYKLVFSLLMEKNDGKKLLLFSKTIFSKIVFSKRAQ